MNREHILYNEIIIFLKTDIVKCISYWHVKDFNISFHRCKRSRTSYEKKKIRSFWHSFLLGPSALKKSYFFHLKQHQKVLVDSIWFRGYRKIYQKWPSRKHIYEGSEFRHIMTNSEKKKKEETGCFTIPLHKVICVFEFYSTAWQQQQNQNFSGCIILRQ